MKTIVVFGSTGMTGRCVLDAAVEKGLNVKAFVRDPAKLPEHLKSTVEVVKGDVLDYESVLNGVKDVDGVVVALGTRNDVRPTTVLSEGLKNILKAMKELNVDVISVCLSAFLFFEPEQVPPIFNDLTEEHKRMLHVLQASDRKYIACFPPRIVDQPPVDYIVKQGASPGGRTLSKFDLGRFLVECLSQPEHYCQIVGICNKGL